MNLEQMLTDARQREQAIAREYDLRLAEYEAKVLQNNDIRRQLKKEEDELLELVPKQSFEKDSEWSKILEEIRALERLIERSGQDD